MKNKHYPLLIIGGGPAGLSAAALAAEHGLACALIDEQAEPGGQIYRAIESIPEPHAKLLGSEYQRGKGLAQAFRNSSDDYLPETRVWSLNADLQIGATRQDQAYMLSADRIIIASGAMERPVPFPGWTLPGVMQAGAGQILFKTAGLVPDNGVVLAGSGPLLLLLAWQYLHAGVEIKALLDVTPLGNHLTALPKLPKALLAHHYLTKGIAYQIDLKRAGVPMYLGVSDLKAEGDEKLQTVQFKHRGKTKTLESELLLTHFGVIPQIALTEAAGCRHDWDGNQQCWRPQHDDWGKTSIEKLWIAGDGAGINGARSAEHAGRLAALDVLHSLKLIAVEKRDQLSKKDRQWMLADRHIRPFLEAYFQLPKSLLTVPQDDTVVCRCEEISAGEIRAQVNNGHDNSNQLKYFTRCGMGPCQGRQCSNAVAHIVADCSGKSIPETGLFRGRPPIAPLTLKQLAAMDVEEQT